MERKKFLMKFKRSSHVERNVTSWQAFLRGGEGEIRTRGPLRDKGFQDLRTRPLCDLSYS